VSNYNDERFEVARISGVGCEYVIEQVDPQVNMTPQYDVTVMSGPASKVLDTKLSWAGAMDLVRDEVTQQLHDELPITSHTWSIKANGSAGYLLLCDGQSFQNYPTRAAAREAKSERQLAETNARAQS